MTTFVPDQQHSASHLRVFLTFVMLLAPVAVAQAQEPTVSKSQLTSQSVAVVSLRPKQMLTNPKNALLPIEVAEAAGEKYLGLDIAHITRAVAVIEPPLGMNMYYAVYLEADEPWDLDQLSPELKAHTEPGEIAGRACLVSREPSAPCFMVLKQTTLVAASQGMLEKLLAADRQPADSVLAELVEKHSADDDLYVAVDLEALRPFINMGLMQASQDAPPEARNFLNIPLLLQSAELTATLDGSIPSRLAFHTSNDSDAAQVEGMLEEAVDLAKANMRGELARLQTSDDPVERAMAAYSERVMGVYMDMFVPKREGTTFVLFDTSEGNAQMGAVAVTGILVALLLPAVTAAREAARRNSSMNNLKMLELALLNYESANRAYPAHAIYSKEGKPLLSWRVAILPYLEEQPLYEQFHLDEPWDSPHNKKLIAQMPSVFSSPNSSLDPSLGKSNYLAPIGKGMVFENEDRQIPLRQITDGTSNTVNLLEVNDETAVEWTKPADWKYDEEDPTKGLTGVRPGVFLAGFCDGHVAAIAEYIDEETFKALLSRNGGEVVQVP
ncbi:DUF1559 domain-containing protein [Aeoliella sp.]|uniref:DUF1559 domain-containing protein n=1 Tax=Aeoliella sp. TaxID=2795800 RepID=UPI003CCC4315